MVPLLALFAPLADLPFEHAPGRIWMKATLNGGPVEALLDSGAAGLFAFEGAAARAGGRKGASFPVSGVGEIAATGWNAKGLRLAFEGTDVALDVPYIVAPAPGFAPRRPIDVAAGFDFLLRYAVEVDYAAGRLRLFNPWTYHAPPDYRELRIRFVDRRPVVDAELSFPGVGWRKVDALLDTGSPGGVAITRRLAEREGLDETYRDFPVEESSGGLSGRAKVRRVGSILCRLAGTELDLPGSVAMGVGGLSGAKADFDVLLGDAALRRFDVVFDYWRGRVFLRPLK